MSEKVVLILVDGMRPDSLQASGHPFIEELKAQSSYTLEGTTVMPSITLPCHMSLFHSVPPQRHGIIENTYTAQVRPIKGLCEQLSDHNKTSALFHNWAQLRDLARPDSISYNYLVSGYIYTFEESNKMLTDHAITYVNEHAPDFTFLYLGLVDEIGHDYGWMSEQYIQAVYDSWACIEKVVRSIPEDYTVFVASDHGGHDRTHGTDRPEDMTIPLFMKGKRFTPGQIEGDVNIIDIAPTIARVLEVPSNADWEGKCLI